MLINGIVGMKIMEAKIKIASNRTDSRIEEILGIADTLRLLVKQHIQVEIRGQDLLDFDEQKKEVFKFLHIVFPYYCIIEKQSACCKRLLQLKRNYQNPTAEFNRDRK